MPRKKDSEREVKKREVRKVGIHLPEVGSKNIDKPGERHGDKIAKPKLSLKTFTANIALAALKAKTITDTEAIKAKRSIYEKDEIMRTLPVTTFDLSEIEVELRFLVEDVEEDDVLITTDPEKISALQNSLSTVKLKLTSKPLLEYTLVSGEKVLKE